MQAVCLRQASTPALETTVEYFSFFLLRNPFKDRGLGWNDPDFTPRSCFLPPLGGQSRPPWSWRVCEINVCLLLWFVPELVMLLEWWSGTECIIHTDPRAYPKYGKENAIVVLNHKFEIDFLCGWSLAERFGVLGVSQTRIYPPRTLWFLLINTITCLFALNHLRFAEVLTEFLLDENS